MYEDHVFASHLHGNIAKVGTWPVGRDEQGPQFLILSGAIPLCDSKININ
jgi:hypothetical protein